MIKNPQLSSMRLSIENRVQRDQSFMPHQLFGDPCTLPSSYRLRRPCRDSATSQKHLQRMADAAQRVPCSRSVPCRCCNGGSHPWSGVATEDEIFPVETKRESKTDSGAAEHRPLTRDHQPLIEGGFMFDGLIQPMHRMVMPGSPCPFSDQELPELGKGFGESIHGFKVG